MSVNHGARVLELELSVVSRLCQEIGTPRALTVSLLINNGEFDQLCSLSVNWRDYDNFGLFSDDYLVTSILQKNPRIPLSVNKKETAMRKFYASEVSCSLSNDRLVEFTENPLVVDADIRDVLFSSQSHVQRILGPFPTKRDLGDMESNMRFGPGSTTSLSGVVTQGKKYSRRTLDVTPRLSPFRSFCFPHLWRQSVPEINLRNYSKLATVPKNAKTDRVICIEPDLNIFVQLGIGAGLKGKLLREGLDLSDQTRNQALASRAHYSGLATLDLSSASDSICREAVWFLLPYAWADLLHLARVDNTCIDGEVVPLHKWSSMGNGYTFELETLIFYAVTLAACDYLGVSTRDVSVYGDDIIVPVEALTLTTKVLKFLGFDTNHEKSFGEGRFHESCGADFFDGHNVRPIFFRSEHHDYESICYLYANNLRLWASRRNGGYTCDSRLLPAWLRLFTSVREEHRHLIPSGFGDVGFISDFDRATPSISGSDRNRGWAGYRFKYRSVRAIERVISVHGSYLAALNSSSGSFLSGYESLRGRFRRPAIKTGYSIEWPNLGPWV